MSKRGNALNVKKELSEELADFMGSARASRPEITKKLWAYIKKHPDTQEGRTIHPDEVLEPILGSKSLDMFQMGKKISQHILD